MHRTKDLLRLLPIALIASACASSGGTQADPGRGGDPVAARDAPLRELPETTDEFLEEAPGIYVVVDLDTNRLRLMDGHRMLWEAPVGTGTGLRLEAHEGDGWHFTTPQGVFQIQYKEEVPVWYLPDWYFIEKNLPVPADNAPERKVRGQLGIAAVYIGREIAIHGTNHPELLGQRVSHGCIRLHNDFALRLFHNVQVGTPVVITGGEDLEPLDAADVPTPAGPKPPEPDPFGGVSTEELLARLDAELESPDTTNLWVRITSRLITRGLKDDPIALRGLLERAGSAATRDRNREYATFLADAFARGGLRAVVSLARIGEEERKLAAEAIVTATASLYPGFMNDPMAPWPTRRVPSLTLGPDGRTGWEALAEAELALRERSGGARANAGR